MSGKLLSRERLDALRIEAERFAGDPASELPWAYGYVRDLLSHIAALENELNLARKGFDPGSPAEGVIRLQEGQIRALEKDRDAAISGAKEAGRVLAEAHRAEIQALLEEHRKALVRATNVGLELAAEEMEKQEIAPVFGAQFATRIRAMKEPEPT